MIKTPARQMATPTKARAEVFSWRNTHAITTTKMVVQLPRVLQIKADVPWLRASAQAIKAKVLHMEYPMT